MDAGFTMYKIAKVNEMQGRWNDKYERAHCRSEYSAADRCRHIERECTAAGEISGRGCATGRLVSRSLTLRPQFRIFIIILIVVSTEMY